MAGQQLLGHWKLDTSENFDEYMRTVGVNFVLRKVGNTLTSYEEWKTEGDQWSLHITSTFKNKLLTFKLGEEFDEETMDGRKVKSVFTLDGDKLIHKQKATKEGEVDSTMTREVLPDGRLQATFVIDSNGVTGKRFFKRYTP